MIGSLSILTELRGTMKTIRVVGEVVHGNAQKLDDALEENVQRGDHVILDLSGVSLMTSPGLGLLIKHTERLRDPERLIIAGLQPKVLEVFRALGLDQFFVIADTADEAARRLAEAPREP